MSGIISSLAIISVKLLPNPTFLVVVELPFSMFDKVALLPNGLILEPYLIDNLLAVGDLKKD